ncbi:MAG: outer membrane lipoprotein chaperone LolA [Castellaniella sp.]|jgi:outer membrane lipoprotein carrier protein|uniref:outer membrane lipoprotein chaperone LolA n=1 Tax=Castellaniella sp. TaxID=1955812 RepID=UPI003C737CA0
MNVDFSNRRRVLAAAIVWCGLAGLPGFSWAAEPAQAQLQAFVSKVKSATGQFSQERTDGKGAAQKPQSGAFAFQRPGKFRWEVRAPYEQLIVSDGQHVYQYDPDLEQVTERRASQAVGASPAALLFGSGSLDEAFNLQPQPDRDGLQWLRAVPKTPDAGFVHADIGFSGGLPRRLELLDAFAQVSRIVFTDLKANPDIPAGQFKFTVPKGADLVKMD